MANTKKRPSLHYLLVGINKYPHLQDNLQLTGCIRDVEAVQTYLEGADNKLHFDKINSQILKDEEATKDKILDGIEKHLGVAQKGDVVLFYFSGHGIRERTDIEILKSGEADDRLGGIVCHDFSSPKKDNPAETIFSNKEFRYLIHKLTTDGTDSPKVHMVLVFDCCHSGSSSRSGSTKEQELASKQIKYASIGGRSMDGFVFSKDKAVKKRIAKIKSKKEKYTLEDLLPQGDHVMIAACREVELAWQPKNEVSIFTAALIDVLQAHKGQISYHELYTRVHNRMSFNLAHKKNDPGQTPQIYVRTDDPSERYNTFLTNQPNTKPTYSTVEFSKSDQNECRIDLGAMHGLPVDRKEQDKVEISVFPVGKQDQAFPATIRQVFLTHSILSYKKKVQKEGITYQAIVKGAYRSSIGVYLDKSGNTAQDERLKDGLEGELENPGRLYHLVEKEDEANIVVRIKDEHITLTNPGDPKRPRVKPLSFKTNEKTATIISYLGRYLQQIGEWWLLKDLEVRPKTALPAALRKKTSMYPVELRVFQFTSSGKEKRLLPNGNVFTIMPRADDYAYLRFEIENFASDLLSCSLIYMTSTFGIWVDPKRQGDGHFAFMNSSQKVLKASMMVKEKWRDETWHSIGYPVDDEPDGAPDYIDFGWPEKEKASEYIVQGNWEVETSYLKLIVSRKPFEIDTFHKPSLPDPISTKDPSSRKGGTSAAALPSDYWEVRTFEIQAVNPHYKAT